MPLHDFRCPAGHVTTEFVGHGIDHTGCKTCGFPHLAEKVFLRAPMAFVRPDICYDSPIDGRPITSMQARIEDLARSNCVPYEEGIKQDGERIKRESEEALERSFDQTVERELATMPARKLEKLTAELEGGMSAEPARITPPQQSFRTA
jgi:hypothetical protein